jgi:hypothetical protein
LSYEDIEQTILRKNSEDNTKMRFLNQRKGVLGNFD